MSTYIYSFYKTTNLVNGKIYYGVHKETKWPKVDEYLGSGFALLRAIAKHGKENFKREVLCIAGSSEYVFYLEQAVVDSNFIRETTNYNLVGGGKGISCHSDETKQKISESNKGKIITPEQRRKMSLARKGKPIPKDQRKQMLETKRKNLECMSLEERKTKWGRTGTQNSMWGREHSTVTRQKIREANLGKVGTFLGQTHTDESKSKMSEAKQGRIPWNKGKTTSPEVREKQRQARQRYLTQKRAQKPVQVTQ